MAARHDSEPGRVPTDPNTLSTEDLDLAAVHTYTTPLLTGVGTVPALGTPTWCALADDDRRKAAAVVLAALSRVALPADPAAEIRAHMDDLEHTQVAEAISSATNWRALSTRPTKADIERDRAQLGSLAHTIDPVAVRRWVATGHSSTDGMRWVA